MKKIFIITLILSACLNHIHAQNRQYDELRTLLNTYNIICKNITMHIDSINKYYNNMSEIAEKDENGINNILSEIASIFKNKNYSKNTTQLNNQIQNLAEYLKVATPKPSPSSDDISFEPPTTMEIGTGPDPSPGESEHSEPPVSDYDDDLQRMISSYQSIKDIYEDKENVLNMLNQSPTAFSNAYINIILLLEIEHEIYNRPNIRTRIQEASNIKKELLLNNHYDELQQEIARMREYRYATTELLRLFKIISNPSNDIKNALKKEGGEKDLGNSKWENNETPTISGTDILYYLMDNNQTKYIDQYIFTKNCLKEYANASIKKREDIEKDITNALK